MNIERTIEKEGNSFCDIYKNIIYYGIRHNYMGMWCGYIVIKPNHPFYKELDEKAEQFTVHGGVTFTNYVDEDFQKRLNDNNINNILVNDYIIGFDCGHAGDLVPKIVTMNYDIVGNDVYRNKEYVISECKNMINQLDKKYPEFFNEYKEIFKKLNS